MNTHTPGPWSYSKSTDGWSYTINIHQAENAEYTPDWSDVAFCTCKGERQGIQEANARLIAAAPDLLAALELIMESYDLNLDEINAARAAIAKARGES